MGAPHDRTPGILVYWLSDPGEEWDEHAQKHFGHALSPVQHESHKIPREEMWPRASPTQIGRHPCPVCSVASKHLSFTESDQDILLV